MKTGTKRRTLSKRKLVALATAIEADPVHGAANRAARHPLPTRTIEVRRVPSLHPKACPDQWEVMIPVLFCSRSDAVAYAEQMVVAGNRMAPQIRTRWVWG